MASTRQRPLKVGLFLPLWEESTSGKVPAWTEVLARAQLAEAVGFDSIWLPDHLILRFSDAEPEGVWEGWSVLAALAAATDRIALGPLVACTSFRNPALLAKMADTVDEISGGRLILGLGAGWNEAEYAAYGFPYDHRVSRFEEAFTIVRELLATGLSDVHGTYHQVDDCELLPRGPRPDGPPLMIGSIGERMLRITLPHVSSWNAWGAWFGNSVEGYLPLRARIDAACRDVGRAPTEVERTLALLVALPGSAGRRSDVSDQPFEPIRGEPDTLVPTLRAFADAGVGHVQLVLDPITVRSIAALEAIVDALHG